MNTLLKFELATYLKKPGIYILLLLLLVLGFLIGFKQLSFNTGAEIYKNAPYSIANMIGFISLLGIFITTLMAALTLFKEADANFSLILYATPITKDQYLYSRFAAVFGFSLLCILLVICGYAIGQLADPDKVVYRSFKWWFYLQPIFIIALPNLFLCSSLVCFVAWLSKNKLMVYLSGLFLYIIYMVLLLYSGSPLMTGGLPQSPEAIALSAKIDPFGLSAFYEQTNIWILKQKNAELMAFNGNLLVNRIIYIMLAGTLLLIVRNKFRLYVIVKQNTNNEPVKETELIGQAMYKPVYSFPEGFRYRFHVLRSLIRLDINFVIKSIPFVLIATAVVFYMVMEFYGTIDQGIRLPEQYATTALMVNRILYNLPGMLILVILFYVHELYWRSIASQFTLIEDSTPLEKIIYFTAKWLSLSLVTFLLITLIICTGIVFQIIYQYNEIDWMVYLSLYWLIAVPLNICAGIALFIQKIINHKWIGLLVTCLTLFLMATSLGKSIGLTNPLLRFAAPYSAKYSEMNGWGDYFAAFSWKMFFGFSFTLLLVTITFNIKKRKQIMASLPAMIFMIACSLISGVYIQYHLPSINENDLLNRQETYELQYRSFHNMPQPTVTNIKTRIDLYPQKNAYHVNAVYSLCNTTSKPINRLLVTFDHDVMVEQAYYFSNGQKINFNQKAGFVTLTKALLPGNKAFFHFSFSYKWDGFTEHDSFNAIIQNGSFIRMSNYFPRFGYQTDLEINNLAERRKRHLGISTPLKKLEAPRGEANDFITLDMTVGTDAGQTAIGVGELTGKWRIKGRNYFKYQTASPIPFRFGISSAAYKLKKIIHQGVNIEVYYDHKHFQNVNHLLKNAARTLDYCQANFSAYPFKTIRFAEVSQFTEGFAGTAYPATIFMTENMIFHTNLKGDKGQDVINELAGHELSHQWWGADQLVPDDREGAKLLTETLAMYTELMMVKHSIGEKRVLDNVAMHKDIYLNERGFSKEEPLYKSSPENIHLYYSKGLVVMFQLSELIGEQNVNKALSNLLQNHAYPNPVPVSTDLLKELYKVSKPSLHHKIDALFKQI